jgi:hypothetical protein
MMKSFGKMESCWWALIGITLFNTFLGEKFNSSALVSILVALTVMCKGLMIIDHFMELRHAHRYLRLLMRAYLIFFPSLIMVTTLL